MMNDVIAEQWPRLNSALHRRWGRLTDVDLARDGSAEYLAQLIAQRYGMVQEVADRQVRDFARRIEKRLQAQSRPQSASPRQQPMSPEHRRSI
jgi:uncharacterized protein YjbJ (UPF0337 family)